MSNVIAHRGASRAQVENTLLAFALAGRMGADAVELDVRNSSDGVLVVHHDPALSDGRIIGQTHHFDLPDRIPTLESALEACKGMWVNIEIKNDPNEPDFDVDELRAASTVDALRSLGELDRWLISSFRMETINKVREIEPRLKTAWLTIGVADADIPNVCADLVAKGHSAIHPYEKLLTRNALGAFRNSGLEVNVWTCDDPGRLEELMQWGVDGICTNVPDIALSIRQQLGSVEPT